MKKLLFWFLLLAPALAQNTVPVTASQIHSNPTTMLPSGTILFQAQGAGGTSQAGQNISYQIGATGPSITAPTVCPIVNGAITGTCSVANVTAAFPQNFCFSVTVKSSTNVVILGGPNSGYQCVQPQPNSNWCSNGTCNFDTFAPSGYPSQVLVINLPPPTSTRLGGVLNVPCPAGQAIGSYTSLGSPICVSASGGSGGAWGTITGTLSNQLDLASALAALAPLNSPALTGTPTAPTQLLSDSSNALATNSFVKGQGYAPLASPAFTGLPTAPTVLLSDSSSSLATTAWVQGQGYSTGSGNVSGPGTSVVGTAALWNSTNGRVLQGSSISFPLSPANIGTLVAGSNGLANSATTDATNAANITSGTLPAARLPNPSSSSFGGVQSFNALANQFLTGLATTGIFTSAQPTCGNLSNGAPSCSTDTTNANNITSGTVSSSLLPNPLFPSSTLLYPSGSSSVPAWGFSGDPTAGMYLTLNPAQWQVSATSGTGSVVTLTVGNTQGWLFDATHPQFVVGNYINAAGIGTGYNCSSCILTAVNPTAHTISYAGAGTSPLSSGTVQIYNPSFTPTVSRITFPVGIQFGSGSTSQNGTIQMGATDNITSWSNTGGGYTSTLLIRNANATAGDLRAAQIGDNTYGAVTALGAPFNVNGALTVTGLSTQSGGLTLSGTCVGVVCNYQPNTYAVNQIQIFPATSTLADLVIGTVGLDPCCSLQAGSTWVNTNGLNGNAHLDFFDGSFYWANITNGDNPCNLANGCSGTGATALINSPSFVTPNIGDATGRSLTLAALTGDQMDLQPGLGLIVNGSLTSGTFVSGETVIQGTSGASSVFTKIEPTGNMLIGGVTGTADATHTWVGQTSGAVFTPTSIPGTPYCQYVPASGHIYGCYASTNAYLMSFNGDPLMPVTRTVGSGTAAMTTAAIGNGACGTTVTVASSNVLSSDVVNFSFSSAPAANPGTLKINAWATSGNVNFEYCNGTGASVTPAATTIRWSVPR